MKRVTTHEAITHLSRLITEVERGEEIVICRGKEPAAKLVSAGLESLDRARPKVGTITSESITYSEDCFDPLSATDLKEWGIL